MDNRIHISMPFGLSAALLTDLEAVMKKHAPHAEITIDIRNEQWELPDPFVPRRKDQPNGQ
jgi:hypothetical protein